MTRTRLVVAQTPLADTFLPLGADHCILCIPRAWYVR